MIEPLEAVTMARQCDEALTRKRVKEGTQGNTPHTFAFCSGTPNEKASYPGGLLPPEVPGVGGPHWRF